MLLPLLLLLTTTTTASAPNATLVCQWCLSDTVGCAFLYRVDGCAGVADTVDFWTAVGDANATGLWPPQWTAAGLQTVADLFGNRLAAVDALQRHRALLYGPLGACPTLAQLPVYDPVSRQVRCSCPAGEVCDQSADVTLNGMAIAVLIVISVTTLLAVIFPSLGIIRLMRVRDTERARTL